AGRPGPLWSQARLTCDDRLVGKGRRLMASGLVRRAMGYLGLADDDYDDYEAYEEPQPVGARVTRSSYAGEPAETGGAVPGIRTIPRESEPSSGSVTVTPRAAGVVRPFTPVQNAKVHV